MITKPIDQWEDLPLEQFKQEVFHLQRRIFGSSQQGNRKKTHRLQKLLLSSFAARCIAVHKVSEINAGRNTAGIDGEKRLTDSQRLQLAHDLDVHQDILPVRRVRIPKPGKSEQRPLGIPAMKDRALQALITLALEPEWEVRFTPGMHGFRKGHRAHDAIDIIRASIQSSPKWVLDADIEKFFDRVDHEALLAKIDTFTILEQAIRRVLKSGSIEGGVASATHEGTPQGGPLSPLLANIALCGLESDLTEYFQQGTTRNAKRPKRMPVMVMYADDFVVLHKDRKIITECREYISAWLVNMGLTIHPEKTRITHTLNLETGSAGFSFLGHCIQQFQTGKYAVKAAFKQVFTLIRPAPEAQERVYQRIATIINMMLCGSPNRNAARRAEEILIPQINAVIRGWSNYFRHCNAKHSFSRLDSLVWFKLWKALRRRYKKRGRQWTVQQFLKRSDGKWRFNCPSSKDPQELLVMRLFAETPILKHMQLRKGKSYFDGDWAYWGTRLGSYPSIPLELTRLLKRQHGKCHRCQSLFTRRDKLHVCTEWVDVRDMKKPLQRLEHQDCDSQLRSNSEAAMPAVDAASSPVR
ncbi:reverse transcriptase domain-containing protein [Prosthecobacter sp.]|uniref:reverse transcriptase domain-containing protein n=1 Tax=Prosthecobacter sp. TaxID=1965333 RepID=UPI0037831CA4